MNIEIKKNTEETTIVLAGRLDTTTAPALDKAINGNVEATENLVLDLKELEYISKYSGHIGSINFFNHQQIRLGIVRSAVL